MSDNAMKASVYVRCTRADNIGDLKKKISSPLLSSRQDFSFLPQCITNPTNCVQKMHLVYIHIIHMYIVL